uniref:SH2 domain containing 3C n=1 Tax=Aquila chrysaetos chrysaetos TaxID=223781 RepID=A0A663FKA5_AQUCH
MTAVGRRFPILGQGSHHDGLESGSEYVKFSKEKYILDSSPEKLHKELEEELKLSSTDLRSHAWYHGRIPREVSESLVQRNGDFLIRDSLTSLGDYVLTCRWRNEPLHFKINKVTVKSSEGHTRVQYLFEQESFDNVPALVRFYVGNRKAISEQSGAIVYCPINRTFPLRYLEASYGLANGKHGGPHSPATQKGGHIKRRSITMTDGLTADKITRAEGCPTSVSLPHHRDIIRNCAVSVDQIQDLHSPMSPISENPVSPAYSTVTRLKPHACQAAGIAPASPVIRRSSEPQLCPGNNSKPLPDPAHSTHSTPCHGYARASPSPSVNSYSDPDTGHYCQLHPTSPISRDRPAHDTKQLSTKSYMERLKVEEGQRGTVENGSGEAEAGQRLKGELDFMGFVPPTMETTSSFNPTAFQSLLIPMENKPLEMAVLKKVKELLAEVDVKTLAKHITKVDCLVARILGVTVEMQRLMGVSSGMELLTLPHGHQLRLDLLERFHTMSIMIAVDILGCTGSMEERAALLHKTIQLAAELKSTMGNMFSFAAVMNALEMTQIARLEQTWMVLRQRHTEGAILYEKKLKPFLKSLNEGKEGPPLTNTTFPHIMPLVTLLERDEALTDSPEPWETTDNGVEVVMAHLEAARMVAHHGGLYHTNAEVKLQGKRWGWQTPFPSPVCGSSPAPDGASHGRRVPIPSQETDSRSLQVSRAERSCWRSSALSSSCGCCGAAVGPRAARPSATRSSTRSSPPCPTSWSQQCASVSCNPPGCWDTPQLPACHPPTPGGCRVRDGARHSAPGREDMAQKGAGARISNFETKRRKSSHFPSTIHLPGTRQARGLQCRPEEWGRCLGRPAPVSTIQPH